MLSRENVHDIAENLSTHINEYELKNGVARELRICEQCNEEFKSKEDYREHLRTFLDHLLHEEVESTKRKVKADDTKVYFCPFCGFMLGYPSNSNANHKMDEHVRHCAENKEGTKGIPYEDDADVIREIAVQAGRKIKVHFCSKNDCVSRYEKQFLSLDKLIEHVVSNHIPEFEQLSLATREIIKESCIELAKSNRGKKEIRNDRHSREIEERRESTRELIADSECATNGTEGTGRSVNEQTPEPVKDRRWVRGRRSLTPRIRGKLLQLPADLLQRIDSEGELDWRDVDILRKSGMEIVGREIEIVLGIAHYLNSFVPMPSKLAVILKKMQEKGKLGDKIDATFLPQPSGTSELTLRIDYWQRALYEPEPFLSFEKLFREQLRDGGDLPCGTKFKMVFDPDSEAIPRLLIYPTQLPERRLTAGMLLDFVKEEVVASEHEDYLYYEADEQVVWLSRNYFNHKDAVWAQAHRAGAFRDVLIETMIDDLNAIGEENRTHWKRIYDIVTVRRLCPPSTVAYLLYNKRRFRTRYKDREWLVKVRNGWFWVEEVEQSKVDEKSADVREADPTETEPENGEKGLLPIESQREPKNDLPQKEQNGCLQNPLDKRKGGFFTSVWRILDRIIETVRKLFHH